MSEDEIIEPTGAPLRRLELGEPLNAWVQLCVPTEEGPGPSGLRAAPRSGETTVVVRLAQTIGAGAALDAIASAAGLADRLVLIASDEDRLSWGALQVGDLRAAAAAPVRLLIEPDPEHAVVGAMQWLARGDTFLVAWPRDERSTLDRFIALGVSWRAAWESPENGEFTPGPARFSKRTTATASLTPSYRGED